MEFRHFTVNREPGVYQGWPDLVRTASGKLLCVFTECPHHKDRSWTRLMLVESDDDGRTWVGKREIASGRVATDGYYWNCARLALLPDGTVAMTVDRCWGLFSKETEIRCEVCLFSSADEGRTWSAPQLLPARGIVPDRLILLDDGRRLIAAHREVDGKLAVFLHYSDDGGRTWSSEITLAKDPRFNLCEAAMLPLGGGTVVCFLRENSMAGYDCKKVISRDRGETWSEVVDFPLPGCHRPTVGQLADGTILLTYRFCQGGRPGWGMNAQNLFAATFDAGSALAGSRREAWARIMPIDYDRSAAADLGYSGWAELPDGSVYLVTYIVDDAVDCAQIRGYRIPPEALHPLAAASGEHPRLGTKQNAIHSVRVRRTHDCE